MPAPVGHTCPMIDEVIETVKKHADTAHDAYSALTDLIGRYDVMEKIRDANSQLRQWGEGLEERVEELEAERDTLQEKLDAAERLIAELQAGIELHS